MKMNQHQGHWALAKLGKRVLRPGGLEMTRVMLDNLHINNRDDVVEFAPGLGMTSVMAAANKPHSYTVVEINQEAADIAMRRLKQVYPEAKVVLGSASQTGLPDGCASVVFGEAMLTMQRMQVKQQIVAEAARLLRPGGLYAIHEIELRPQDIDDGLRHDICRSLQSTVMNTVTPLTREEWIALLAQAGLEAVMVYENGMDLLEPRRMLADEGIWRCLKIAFKALSNKHARHAMFAMRANFKKYHDNMGGICIVARKR